MNTPIRHHFVPESYQKLFCSEDQERLYYYDKKESEIKGLAKPKNFCREKHLYRLTELVADILKFNSRNDIENPMLSNIDGLFVSSVKKIILNDPLNRVTDQDLYNMAIFLGFLPCRFPKSISDYEGSFSETLIQHILELDKQDSNMVLKAEEMGLDLDTCEDFKGLNYSGSRDIALIKMIETSTNLARHIFDKMSWEFLISEQKHFILSDAPFVIVEAQDTALFTDLGKDLFFIPLSKELCLVMQEGPKTISSAFIKEDGVSAINQIIFDRAYRWIIGGTKEDLQILL